MAIVWLVVGVVLVGIGAVFRVQNPQAVDLYVWTLYVPRAPFWLVVAVPALAGLLLGVLLHVPDRVRRALVTRRLAATVRERDRTIGQLQQRVTELERDRSTARAAAVPDQAAVERGSGP